MFFLGVILSLAIVLTTLNPIKAVAQTYNNTQNYNEILKDTFPLTNTNSQTTLYIANITVTGNRETKEKIILRETTFKTGDTITAESLQNHLEQTKNNLLKLSLFNYVTITTIPIEENIIDININVEERGYIWPIINITPHNGNLNDWLGNIDFSKIDYCFGVKKYNFRGRKEAISLNFRRGYNNFSEIGYSDIAVDKKRKNILGFYFSTASQTQTILTISNNKAIYQKFEENKAISQYLYTINYSFRQTLNITHSLTYNHQNFSIHDSIAILNPDYLGDGKNSLKFNSLKYSFRIDHRNSSYYPLHGWYCLVGLSKKGLFENNLNTYSMELDLRQYFNPLPNTYLSMQIYALNCGKNTPFAIRQSIGTKPNIIAGYEQYQIPGNNIVYTRTSLKFKIIPTHIIHLKKIPLPKFNKIHITTYANIFANAGWSDNPSTDISAKHNKLNNTFLGAIGLGLDIVTYYDKVFCIYVAQNIQNDFSIGIGFKSFF